MASKQGEPSGKSKASRPAKLSLQQVLDAVLDSDSDKDVESDFCDSSLDEEGESSSDVDDNTDDPPTDSEEKATDQDNQTMNVSSYSSGNYCLVPFSLSSILRPLYPYLFRQRMPSTFSNLCPAVTTYLKTKL